MPYGKGTYSKPGRPKANNSGKGHSRKGKTKNTNYRPGKRVPAIEESLYKKDDIA